MTNVVTLELTGDESSLEDAISRATQQVKNMDTAVATASTSVDEHSGKMDRMAERSDRVATSTGTLSGALGAMSSGLVLLGVNADSTTAKVVGGLSVGFATLQGVADVARLAMESQTVATIASKVATVAGAAATGIATAAQWAWNIAMEANPIGLIIIAVVALIAIIVLIATKTTWFQDLWKVTWNAIKVAASAVADFFVDTVWHNGIEKAFNLIGNGVGTVKGWFTSIPGMIKSAFSGLVDIITWPYRTAFNFISDAWNNTIGKLSWTVPSWVPVVGGKSISAPKLPHFHSGGMVDGPGPIGSEVLAVLQVGERVQTREMQAAEGGGGSVTYNITVNGNKFSDGTDFEQWLDELRNDGRGGGGVDE